MSDPAVAGDRHVSAERNPAALANPLQRRFPPQDAPHRLPLVTPASIPARQRRVPGARKHLSRSAERPAPWRAPPARRPASCGTARLAAPLPRDAGRHAKHGPGLGATACDRLRSSTNDPLAGVVHRGPRRCQRLWGPQCCLGKTLPKRRGDWWWRRAGRGRAGRVARPGSAWSRGRGPRFVI